MAAADAGPLSDPAAGVAVDVVVTNHNYGRYLRQALESALAQDHPEVSVIVVDDGSEDDSVEIISEYADRVEAIFQPNSGQAAALNAAFERCGGDVLLLLDADDRLHPWVASMVSAAFAADPRLAKVQFGMDVIDAAGDPTGEVRPQPGLPAPHGDLRQAELDYPFDLPWLPGGGTAFRLRDLRRILPIPVADYPRVGADWYLVHLSALLGDAAAVDRTGYEYRFHGQNGYQQDLPSLDLEHVRDSVRFAAATTASLEGLADSLGLRRPERILSTADLANRLISLRLAPAQHPLPDDDRRGIVADAMRALRRRSDVSPLVKALFGAWFVAEALAPRPAARSLATVFLFPERRALVTRFLRRPG